MKTTFILISILFFTSVSVSGQHVKISHNKNGDNHIFTLKNRKITQIIVIKNGKLVADTLKSNRNWVKTFHRKSCKLISDAGFNIRVVYNAWRAPGKKNNADNPVDFDKSNFNFTRWETNDNLKTGKQLQLYFKGTGNPLVLRLTYQLGNDDFFIRRNIAVKDPTGRGHFLDKISPRQGRFAFIPDNKNRQNITVSVEGLGFSSVENDEKTGTDRTFFIDNEGGFGQPVAFRNEDGGGFTGLEYPTGTTTFKILKNNIFYINSFQYTGSKIEQNFLKSNSVVTAITPQPYVKKWFYDYVKSIRVAPAKPYTLYNSWYDLRSPAFLHTKRNKIDSSGIMNEKNTLRIIRLLRDNMIKKHGIHLDAFVLDDGWDIYESDWQLNPAQFPHGLKPISDTLAKTGTRLGIWFGPIGGYSFALKRIKWMAAHGYEVTGHKFKYGSAMLCLAGKNYSKLFRKRVTGFTKNYHIGYFKWDGIQFACSEPDHGHPVGIYSRRAVMESVIDKCQAVRAIDSSVYINITSGTWLSPWWVQYANQIWMDAADYAFAGVPSLNRRDNAMTYRDYALYNDLKIRNLWFPVANLMTHGIIKGRLEAISKEGEPFDRFTNNAVLYFARGVTMWELYISPDILNDKEWRVLSQAIQWAYDNQNLMEQTFMQGGNPALGEPYAYLHFKNNKGLIAARNPKIDNDTLRVSLKPEHGIDENATNLVIEQVFPYRKILPQIYSAGSIITIPLDGFETVIFHVYPLDSVKRPLPAGARFDLDIKEDTLKYNIYETGNKIKFLNPQYVENLIINRKSSKFQNLDKLKNKNKNFKKISYKINESKNNITWQLKNPEQVREVAVLLTSNGSKKDFPGVSVYVSGKKIKLSTQKVKGEWKWYSSEIGPGQHNISIKVNKNGWKGKVELWVNKVKKLTPVTVRIKNTFKIKTEILPPLPYPANEKRDYIKITEKNF